MKNIERVLEKASVGSILIAALSCAGCFPALGSLAAAIGLGFLGQLEGVMINKLLPVFAGFALLLSIYSWSKHRIHWRGLISTLPPIAILVVLYPLWKYAWSTYLFYSALVMMVIVSIGDVIWPAEKYCQMSGVDDA